jgi:hypothetical protein
MRGIRGQPYDIERTGGRGGNDVVDRRTCLHDSVDSDDGNRHQSCLTGGKALDSWIRRFGDDRVLVGKLLGLGATGLFQMLVWVLTGVVFVLLLGRMVEIPPDLVLLPTVDGFVLALLYFILGYFFFGTLMAALGAITTSQREANQVTFLIVLPGVAPLWFLQALFENPDGTLAQVLTYVPFTAPTVSLLRLHPCGCGLHPHECNSVTCHPHARRVVVIRRRSR